MVTRSLPDKFLVAFSFAGEQRELVRAVVDAVESELGAPNVFYDEWFEYYIAGGDSALKLQQIYGERSVLAVVCVSGPYGNKPWTRAEHAAIRARYMQAQGTDAELGILPLRVGEGEVEGILFNTIVPDIRGRTPADAARLIVNRLRLLQPRAAAQPAPVLDWPDQPTPMRWPIANHTVARAAFEQLVTRAAAYRFLPVRGPSEVGKTHITKQMLGNVLHASSFACGRFDFKGTTDMDGEIRSFLPLLDVPLPPSGLRLNERLSHILDALKRRAGPTLLIFDTYEAAGEARDWVERQLLPALIRAPWLRVVIAGQRVPEPSGALWEAISCPVVELMPPLPEEWFAFALPHKPAITMEFVRQAYALCGGRASVMAALLGPR